MVPSRKLTDASWSFRGSPPHPASSRLASVGLGLILLLPQGDSGGPLICDGILQGVDSFVIRECASLQFPDFFARVSMYVDWIHTVLRGAEP